MRSGAVLLLYHELERPAVPLCESSRGYSRYAVAVGRFREHLGFLAGKGYRVGSVGDCVKGNALPEVVITFDDGCATDLTVAAPLLREHGFAATFFITVDFLSRPGYLSVSQLRELATTGFEVGSHAVTHRYLTDLPVKEMREEVGSSRDRLEQMIGSSVRHFSCPGGRWDDRVVDEVRNAGYVSMCTSRVGTTVPGSDPYRLPREAVLRDTTQQAFERLCARRGVLKRRARAAVLDLARGVLGNARYEAVRGRLLGDSNADS